MDEQSVILLADKITSDINFWIALIGLAGVVIGALLTGIFSWVQNNQVIKNEKMEKKKELLLMKYEGMYRNLDDYYIYAQEISLLTVNSIDTSLDITKLKSNLKDNDFIMFSRFYAPDLSTQMEELTKKLVNVIEPLSELIIKKNGIQSEKEKLIGNIVTSSFELQGKVKSIQLELAKLTTNLMNT